MLLGCTGCLAPILAVIIALSILHLQLGLAVVALLIGLLVMPIAKYWFKRQRVIAAFRAKHAESGKDMLIVYSDSALWKEYIEAEWLPKWRERAVIFNRSQPWREEAVESRLWRSVAGQVEHTHVVIVVPGAVAHELLGFWRAFRERKFSGPAKLREQEQCVEELASKLPGR